MRELPDGLSLDAALFSTQLLAHERVEMVWQVLRLVCEEHGYETPSNPLAETFESALAGKVVEFFVTTSFPYDEKVKFIKMVRQFIIDYNASSGKNFDCGLRKAKEFVDVVCAERPFTKLTTKNECMEWLFFRNVDLMFTT